jgi:predicted Zn-dependent protease
MALPNVQTSLPQGSDVRILRELLALCLLFAVVAGGVYSAWRWWPSHHSGTPGLAHDDSSLLMGAEGRLRELVRREVTLDAVKDPSVSGGIRKIQERIAQASGKLPFPIEIYVIDSPTINAVCLPGGIIVVYSGLIRRLEAPEELAAILAHESAHALHRDSMHALERELGVAALFTLAGGRSDALTVRLLRRLIGSGFSRQQEQDADQEAQRVLGASDIDPGMLAESLRHIRKMEGDDPVVLQYLSTHPDIDSRIKTSEGISAAWKGKARPIEMDWKQFRGQFRLLR